MTGDGTRGRAGRPRHKQDRILEIMRQRLSTGAWAPGARLPTRVTLCTDFATSVATLQGAINVLLEEGALVADGARGTFVAEAAPWERRFALVMTISPLYQRPWSRFYMALDHEARVLTMEGQAEFVSYFIQGGKASEPDYARLLTDLDAGRLGGLLFANAPFEFYGSPVLERPGVPRVAIASSIERTGMPCLYADLGAFARRAVRYLHGQRRRRLAVVTQAPALGPFTANLEEALHDAGMAIPLPAWRLSTSFHEPDRVRQAVSALFAGPRDAWPDALLINDDNLVEAATAGLSEAGVRVPEEVEVVVMWNYEVPPPCSVSAYRLGFDYRTLLSEAIRSLRRQQSRVEEPCMYWVPPLEEAEWSAATAERVAPKAVAR